jgi:pimeloyl-ACP methyl ester carboxylesterase
MMDRRHFLASTLRAGIGSAIASTSIGTRVPSLGIYYEVHGRGVPLILGAPLKASPTKQDPRGAILKGYLDRLTDRYRVLVADYPDLGLDRGRSTPLPAGTLTAQRACDDVFAMADAAGFERFIWWGFSWGGVVGLQLASRSDRVAALVCGGWPPLGGPYADMLRIARARVADPSQAAGAPRDRQMITFYESLQRWPEAEAIRRIRCPRMAYAGTEDTFVDSGVSVRLGPLLRERRADLEREGWSVAEIPGRDHSVFKDPEAVVPIVRRFLDATI